MGTKQSSYFTMKLELCNFSGYKIYPGHGKTYIRIDGKLFTFLSKKSERSFLMKRNPRKISWTVLYRKKHKKGTQEEVAKKRTRRNIKFQHAIQAAKDKAKSVKTEKRAAAMKKNAGAGKKPQQKAFNKMPKSGGAGRVGGKR